MIAYLDTNALSHLKGRQGADREDEARLRDSIRSGQLCMLLSVTILEEALAVIERDERRALDRLRWIVGVVGVPKLVKPAGGLLNDSIRAYAMDAAPPTPYVTLNLAIRTPCTRSAKRCGRRQPAQQSAWP